MNVRSQRLAVRESNSNPTTASSPDDPGVVPGSITYACPARISCSVPSSWTFPGLPGRPSRLSA